MYIVHINDKNLLILKILRYVLIKDYIFRLNIYLIVKSCIKF